MKHILFETDSEVRHVTIDALTKRKDVNIIPNLVKALASKDPAVVNRAGWSLGQLNAVTTVPKLIPALITIQYQFVMPPVGGWGAGGGQHRCQLRLGHADAGPLGRGLRQRRNSYALLDSTGHRPGRCRVWGGLDSFADIAGHGILDGRRRLAATRAAPADRADHVPECGGSRRPGQADRARLRLRRPDLEALGLRRRSIPIPPRFAASPNRKRSASSRMQPAAGASGDRRGWVRRPERRASGCAVLRFGSS